MHFFLFVFCIKKKKVKIKVPVSVLQVFDRSVCSLFLEERIKSKGEDSAGNIGFYKAFYQCCEIYDLSEKFSYGLHRMLCLLETHLIYCCCNANYTDVFALKYLTTTKHLKSFFSPESGLSFGVRCL